MTAPTIHLNGTSGPVLIEQNRAARVALRTALDVLQEARPHGRDYYTQAAGAYERAKDEHLDRMRRLESIIDELEEIENAICERTQP